MDEYHELYGTKPYDLWKLSESVSVVEAALLLLNIEPQGVSDFVDDWHGDQQPFGYVAARNAVASALQTRKINGSHEFLRSPNWTPLNREWEESSVDAAKSTVNMDSLRSWLYDKGFDSEFFGTKSEKPSFQDVSHPRYSPKLAAVVEAWEAFDGNDSSTGTAKQKLEKWLRLNAAKFGFTDENGLPQESVITSLAKVANWARRGGAPKQSGEEPDADF